METFKQPTFINVIKSILTRKKTQVFILKLTENTNVKIQIFSWTRYFPLIQIIFPVKQ